MSWDLNVGDVDTRTAIQQRHGGSHSRGISAPAARPEAVDIMLWWRPEHGEQYGYTDGWASDGAFYFTGTGQYGDQRFEAPNAENGRVRDHKAAGDRLRLLRYTGNNSVRYLGEFALDVSNPWLWRDGPDRLGRMRKMIQFRLLPVGEVEEPEAEDTRDDATTTAEETVEPVPPSPQETAVEALAKKEFQRLVRVLEQVARREELELVHGLRSWLFAAHGLTATGLRIPTGLGLPPLRADLWVPSRQMLIEAKASASREHVRTAIGQLLDYARYLPGSPTRCLLVPTLPADDMMTLLESLGIACIWKSGVEFQVEPTALLL